MVSWDVTVASWGDAEDCCVVAFAFLEFSSVVDFGVRVVAGGDERCGEEHGVSRGGGCRLWVCGRWLCCLTASPRERGA